MCNNCKHSYIDWKKIVKITVNLVTLTVKIVTITVKIFKITVTMNAITVTLCTIAVTESWNVSDILELENEDNNEPLRSNATNEKINENESKPVGEVKVDIGFSSCTSIVCFLKCVTFPLWVGFKMIKFQV